MFQNVTLDLGNEQGQVTCTQLLLALEGVPEDVSDGPRATTSRALATAMDTRDGPDAAFDSVSVDHPSTSVSAGLGSSQGLRGGDSACAASRLSPVPGLEQPRDQSRQGRTEQHDDTDTGSTGAASSTPRARTMMSGSLAGTGGASTFASKRGVHRSASWSLSDAESMPALPPAAVAVASSPSQEPVVTLENVTFNMQHDASRSASSMSSGEDITISGVVRGGAGSSMTAIQMRALRAEAGLTDSVGVMSGAASSTANRSQGLYSSGDHSQRTDTSGLVCDQIVGGTVTNFLDSAGREIGESVERGSAGHDCPPGNCIPGHGVSRGFAQVWLCMQT